MDHREQQPRHPHVIARNTEQSVRRNISTLHDTCGGLKENQDKMNKTIYVKLASGETMSATGRDTHMNEIPNYTFRTKDKHGLNLMPQEDEIAEIQAWIARENEK